MNQFVSAILACSVLNVFAIAESGSAAVATGDTGAKVVGPAPVDLILTGGRIRTPQGWAEAVAISKGVIVAVDDAAKVETLREQGTELIQLDDRTVLPGLGDMHVHSTRGGLEQIACRIVPGSDADDIARVVAECVAAKQPGDWVTGGNWVAAGFAAGQQNRAFLDELGSIEPGMHADLIVVEKNPFEVPITQVHKTRVLMTFIDGEKVFDVAAPPRLTGE